MMHLIENAEEEVELWRLDEATQPDTVLRKFLKLHGLEMFYSVLDEFLIRVK